MYKATSSHKMLIATTESDAAMYAGPPGEQCKTNCLNDTLLQITLTSLATPDI